MKNLQAVAQALEALDFTDENAKIAELEASLSELEAAIERGQARRSEIARVLIEGGQPPASAVADALLADPTTAAAAATAPDRAALESEKDALGQGIRELSFRAEDIRAEISTIKGQAMVRACDTAKPLTDEVIATASELLAGLLPLYATLSAISSATKARINSIDRMRDVIVAARGLDGLISNQRSVDVPVDLIKALRPIAEKGAAMGDARFLQSVGLP